MAVATCVFTPPPTPWPPSIRHNTLKMESVVGKYIVRDHAWVIQPRTYALTPDDNIEAVISVNVHDSVPDGVLRNGSVMEFQFLTVFPDCSSLQEVSGFYNCSLNEHGAPVLEFHMPPYGPEAYLHGNPFWPPGKALDEGTWMTWIESEVHSLFDLNTDIDWRPGAIIQVYAHRPPTLITKPIPEIAVENMEIQDIAVLTDCIEPHGTIEWKLYDAGGTVVYTNTVNVFGNGTYYSGFYHLPALLDSGEWRWHAKYSGDPHNPEIDADDEPFQVHRAFEEKTSTDQWTIVERSVPAVPRVPGIARFKHDTPDLEQYFKSTAP